MTISKRVKQVYISFLIVAVLAVLHGLLNLVYDKQEWISLLFLLLSLIVFIIAITYSTMEFAITKEPSDLWKVGFLGLFGLIGLIPGVGYGFFGLFGLFGFFGSRQYF
jgi:FtsH-binding integral membrane protein